MYAKRLDVDIYIRKLLSINPRIMLLCTHTVVTLTMVLCQLSGIILLLLSDIEYFKNKFLAHGFANKQYFFSLWVLASATIFFGLYSVIDLISIYGRKSEKAIKIRKTLYSVASHILFSITFPLSIVVSIFFWSFYIWNREVIYPAVMDNIFPPFLNHMMHTYPAPVAVLYMFTDIKTEPSKTKTFSFLTLFIAIYCCVFFEVRKRNGYWIYYVFETLTTAQITWTLLSALLGSFLFHYFGYFIFGKIKEIRSYLGAELNKLKN